MNVIADGGLVGIVTSVGSNWATVRSIIDDYSNVSAEISSTSDNCIIAGNLKLIDEGKTGMLFESGNAKELKARIGQMFATPFEYRQIALDAQKRYSAERYYTELLKIYNNR